MIGRSCCNFFQPIFFQMYFLIKNKVIIYKSKKNYIQLPTAERGKQQLDISIYILFLLKFQMTTPIELLQLELSNYYIKKRELINNANIHKKFGINKF